MEEVKNLSLESSEILSLSYLRQLTHNLKTV